jgi:hypothetical protein
LKTKPVVFVAIFLLTGILFVHPVFAHNFVQDSNADLIAKIQEFKTESSLIANNIPNSTLAQWHITKSQGYFGSNEINGISQINSTLSSNLSAAIDDLYSLSGQTSMDPTVATQKADALNQIMDQVESTEISSSEQSNSTIESLAIINVLHEVLADYGTAIGSTVDLNNMTNMDNMNMGNNMQGMSGMSGTMIVNAAAYQSAQALADTAQSMFNNFQSTAPSSASPYLVKISSALGNLKQAINSKESGNDVMMIVHENIHPNFISAFNIQTVPEFPTPILLAIISFIGIISMSRILQKLR